MCKFELLTSSSQIRRRGQHVLRRRQSILRRSSLFTQQTLPWLSNHSPKLSPLNHSETNNPIKQRIEGWHRALLPEDIQSLLAQGKGLSSPVIRDVQVETPGDRSSHLCTGVKAASVGGWGEVGPWALGPEGLRS